MKVKKWKTLACEYLFRRPWLTARRDTVELPDGRINAEYYILEYPDWVNVIAITEAGEFVMVEQYRHGLGDVFTELVAGVIEKGEDPLEAAKRELLEETGYAADEWSLNMVISQNTSTTTNLTYSYIAKGAKKVSSQHLDATEDISVRILPEAEILRMLKSDEIKQSLMAAPLWKYFALKA